MAKIPTAINTAAMHTTAMPAAAAAVWLLGSAASSIPFVLK